MLYELFNYISTKSDFAGSNLITYITVRTALSVIVSLLISLVFGKSLIEFLRRKQIGESVRDLGLEGESQKKGTPTMGGLIMLGAMLIPTLLFAKLDNIYIWVILVATVGLGLIGFLDDYIKVFKKQKSGLSGKYKILGQVIIGAFVAISLMHSDNVVVQKKYSDLATTDSIISVFPKVNAMGDSIDYVRVKTKATTIPFWKNNEFDYGRAMEFMGKYADKASDILYIIVVIFIITAVSNGANITDGLDGLAAGTSAIIGFTLAVLTYVSGNSIWSEYLNIMYIPNLSELSIFVGAFVGACIGFLWYNANPAQVFMGDTGSLSLGGIIGVLAVFVRKELMIPIICGIFLVENLSVIIQVAYFKYTKKKYGEGRRIFLMAPLHHHYQLKGYKESKIAVRFWIVGILLAIFSLLSLKIR